CPPAGSAARGQFQVRAGAVHGRPRDRGRDVVCRAGALQAGRADLDPGGAVWRDHDPGPQRTAGSCRLSLQLEATVEALLFLSPEPAAADALAGATGAQLHEVVSAL